MADVLYFVTFKILSELLRDNVLISPSTADLSFTVNHL